MGPNPSFRVVSRCLPLAPVREWSAAGPNPLFRVASRCLPWAPVGPRGVISYCFACFFVVGCWPPMPPVGPRCLPWAPVGPRGFPLPPVASWAPVAVSVLLAPCLPWSPVVSLALALALAPAPALALVVSRGLPNCKPQIPVV